MLSFFILALLTLFSVNALVVPRKAPPPGWATDYLEPYVEYHTRYLALSCHLKHNSPFFDRCCHPLLATETLQSSRAAECVPSPQAMSAAAIAPPTSTIKTPTVDDCDDDNDHDADDEEFCDDNDDDNDDTSPPPAPSPKPEPAKVSPPPPSKPPATKPSSDSTPKNNSHAKPPKSGGVISGIINNIIGGGFATFFYQNGVAGACGITHNDGDYVAAMDSRRYGNTGEKSSLCGKKVEVINTKNQKSVQVTIADACPTCKNENSIDLSKAAFLAIATEEEGMVPIDWRFI